MRILFVAIALFLIQGCAAFELSPEEKAIQERASSIPIANAITVTELTQYNEFGPLSCEEDTTYSYGKGGADEICRRNLKIQAARLTADLVILESHDLAKCSVGDHLCVYMQGPAYKKIEIKK